MKDFLSPEGVAFQAKLMNIEANRREVLQYPAGPSPLTVVDGKVIHGVNRAAFRAALALRPDLEAPVVTSVNVSLALGVDLRPTVAVGHYLEDSVYCIDAATGALVGGACERSGVRVHGKPIFIEASKPGGTLAAIGYGSGDVTFISLRDGGYVRGSLGAATLPSGDRPRRARPASHLLHSGGEGRAVRGAG